MDRSRDEGRPGGLAEVLSLVARDLQAEPDVEATVGAIVKAAVAHMGVEYAGVSLVERRAIRTVAPTSPLVTEIDEVQYRLDKGPCVDAVREEETFLSGDLARECRWPELASFAADRGIHSMVSYRLFISETTLGALNLYSSRVDAFPAGAEQDGRLFASHAAIALVGAQHTAQLQEAIESRDLIGMAKGILMERHDVDPAAAFRMLAQASQNSNMKVHDVTTWLVTHRREL